MLSRKGVHDWVVLGRRVKPRDAYLGGIKVPNVGCASSHGFPSTSAMCSPQTRLTTNGHLATYFAVRGQRCASQSLLSANGSNSGPRLFVSIATPAPFRSIWPRDLLQPERVFFCDAFCVINSESRRRPSAESGSTLDSSDPLVFRAQVGTTNDSRFRQRNGPAYPF